MADIIHTYLTNLLRERDFRTAINSKLPRTFFTDVMDANFWRISPGLMVQTKRINKEEMLLLPNVYDSFVSDDIRTEVIALREDLKMRRKPSLKACSMRSGDSVCLIQRNNGSLSYLLMTFWVAEEDVQKARAAKSGGTEISPLCQVDTSYSKLRYSRSALDRVFFTADTHFSEERILRYRPRFSSTTEMDEFLIGRWNEVVPRNGIVFHLGDFSDMDIDSINRIAIRLNGKIFLVPGNHDNKIQTKHSTYKEQSIITCLDHQKTLQYGPNRIILNHYPLLCYPRAYSGRVWQLFGHVHTGSAVPGNDIPRLQYLLPYQYDVGVENNNYYPISLREIVRRFSAVEIKGTY